MGMTNNQIRLIEALSYGRLEEAKRYAMACCTDDNTSKNHSAVERLKRILQESSLTTLSTKIKDKVYVEDVSTFHVDRYFVNDTCQRLKDQIIKANKIASMLEEMDISYLNSTLLYGEPGTGKTMFGRFIAHEMERPFLYVNMTEVVSSLMGESGKNIKNILTECRNMKSIIMLDEIDCIGAKRSCDSSGASGEISRTTITLLQELDRMGNAPIIIAATNRPDVLDNALLRRFTHKIEFLAPNEMERAAIAEKYLNALSIPHDEEKVKKYASEKRTQAEMVKFAKQIVIDYLASTHNIDNVRM